ncbi:hypothetical protein EJ08DRAFT_580981 [Tothia fuscella]|uniref:Serine-threonine protein kinase 19-domain-containing protein n=1 Tax=Tothia fuscella TaxID=1048955 RepID=A0A9P4P102_9PEZI|nr:hypothetical protein EJ08DRAFT_580981 [Tothia fuscella]
MPLRLTAASSSSRVRKPGQRTSASPFANAKRRKPLSRTTSTQSAKTEEDEPNEIGIRLEDDGIIASLAFDLNFSDVAQLLVYISNHQWTPIPHSGAGMNSTRIAEVLNYRRRLPPIVSVAHVHAMSSSPTTTEREIATLIDAGVVRRVSLPARGEKGPAVGEGLVLVDEWVEIVQGDGTLSHDVKDKYIHFLRNPSSQPPAFSPTEITTLSSAGLVTRSAAAFSNADIFLRPGATTLGSLNNVSIAGSSHASGSRRSIISSSSSFSSSKTSTKPPTYTPSLPNTGPYLKILMESRAHLVSLLSKMGGRYREATRDMLKERWDGGVAGGGESEKAQRARGEWRGVLPGRTKKWKSYYGLEFAWVLEESVGAGMVECFSTGSVGLGVRVI